MADVNTMNNIPSDLTQTVPNTVNNTVNNTPNTLVGGYQDDNNAPKIQVSTPQDSKYAKYKILVIEDNSDVRFQYEFALKKAGFTVITATNGEEGIVKAIKERPQLILLDILMPEMDGWTALKALREYTSTYRPHIVILSNLGSPDDIQKAYTMGADMFLVKANVTLLQVTEKIKEILDSPEASAAVIMLPLDIDRPEVKQLLKSAPPDARKGICPLDGAPLGLKLTPVIKEDKEAGKKTQEYIARITCMKCGKEFV